MTARLRTGLALLATASFVIAGSATASAACPGEDIRANAQSDEAIEASVLCLINERRSQAGLHQVVHNSLLAAAADRHSTDMVDRGYFSHTAPGGVGFIDRIVDTGYTRTASSWLVGENLVWGSGGLSTPRQLVQAWMDSPPHRENLLRARFREVGIGALSGTPVLASDEAGVTVSSEYGYRGAKKGKKAKKGKSAARRAKARAAKRRAARRARS